MRFLERIKIFFKDNLSYPRFYLGKSLKSVPPGSFILFPAQGCQLNCGLTGIVAFKREEVATPKIPLNKIESMVFHIKGCTYKKIQKDKRDLIENYLGGETFIKELQNHIGNLKLASSLYTLFQEAPTKKKLEKISLALEKVIGREENEHHKILNLLPVEENEIIIKRINLLKDIHWSLKEETLKNLEKIEELSTSTNADIPFLAFKQIKNINTLFNNLDRLEVRGRDSAGISVITIIENKDYLEFEKELTKRLLLDEFLDRQKEKILGNRCITINRHGNTVSITFTYKIAAQIGHLGENVRYLRKQIHDDRIFHSFIKVQNIHQTHIAHTRWASVGEISEPNCHPVDNAILHNDKVNESINKAGTILITISS
jgi:glucosamine--fructose-6-phosphate aminotransferase (isomerizing)